MGGRLAAQQRQQGAEHEIEGAQGAHLGVNELVMFGYVWIIWMCFLWLDSLAFFASDVSGKVRSDRGQAGMVHEVRS